MENAFLKLKTEMTSASVVAFSNFEKPFVVDQKAFLVAVGAVLLQKKGDSKVLLIQSASRTVILAKRKYSIYEQEAFMVIFVLKTFCL